MRRRLLDRLQTQSFCKPPASDPSSIRRPLQTLLRYCEFFWKKVVAAMHRKAAYRPAALALLNGRPGVEFVEQCLV
jgi:hypothetical protein